MRIYNYDLSWFAQKKYAIGKEKKNHYYNYPFPEDWLLFQGNGYFNLASSA